MAALQRRRLVRAFAFVDFIDFIVVAVNTKVVLWRHSGGSCFVEPLRKFNRDTRAALRTAIGQPVGHARLRSGTRQR